MSQFFRVTLIQGPQFFGKETLTRVVYSTTSLLLIVWKKLLMNPLMCWTMATKLALT